MPLETGEEECLVLSVVESRNHDLAARGRTHFVIREGIARNDRVRERRGLAALQLLEILAMHEPAVEIPVLQAAVELVGAALHHTGELPAGVVPEFGRQSGGVHLELLDHVERSRHHCVEVVGISQNGFLRVDAVDREAERALPLSDGVLAVDDVHAGHVEVHAIERLLQHRHLDDGLPFENLAAGGRLGLEQGRRARDLDGFGDVTDFEVDVDTGLLGGAQGNAALDIRLEARALRSAADTSRDSDSVCTTSPRAW